MTDWRLVAHSGLLAAVLSGLVWWPLARQAGREREPGQDRPMNGMEGLGLDLRYHDNTQYTSHNTHYTINTHV